MPLKFGPNKEMSCGPQVLVEQHLCVAKQHHPKKHPRAGHQRTNDAASPVSP